MRVIKRDRPFCGIIENRPSDLFPMTNRRAVITQLAYALGDLRFSLEESFQKGRTVSPVSALRDAGFSEHLIASLKVGCYDLARACVEKFPKELLQSVDAIIYASSLPENSNIGNSEKARAHRDVKYLMDYPASHLQADLGMERAIIFGITQQACTGLLGSFRLAKMLIQSEPDISKVLCLTVDRFPEGALYEQAFNLISDGAAGAIVEADADGLEIRSCHQLSNGKMAQATDEETVGQFFNYSLRLIRENLNKEKIEISNIRWIVPQNVSRLAWQILGRFLGFPFERVALRTIGKIGHMISGDNIPNLLSLQESHEIQPGDSLLLLTAGYGLNWQSLILKKTAGDSSRA